MLRKRIRGLRLLVLAPWLLLASTMSSSWASDFANDSEEPRYVLGGEACRDYLLTIAKDPSLQTLYDAWLAGYVRIAGEDGQGAAELVDDADLADARAWVKSYCARRASDTFLKAAVRFLETKERSGWREAEPEPAAIQVAGRS
jgi:hypothetical protein